MALRSPVSRSIYAEDLWGGGEPGTNWFVRGSTGDDEDNDGQSWDTPFATVQAAIDAATAGDRVYVAAGSYDESVSIGKRITLVGAGQRGVIAVAPTTTNATAVTVTGDFVNLINIGCEGDGTGSGLHVKECNNFYAYQSSIEGGAVALKLESTGTDDTARPRFEECDIAWSTDGVNFVVSGGGDPVTQTHFKKCRFHNITTACIEVVTTHTADLWVEDCVFLNNEDGTEPTDYILANVANTTGAITGCYFADTAHIAAKITLASGVLYVGNYAEDGVNTARPA